MSKLPRVVSAADAVAKIGSGESIYISSSGSVPRVLVEALCARGRKGVLRNVFLRHIHTGRTEDYAAPEFEGVFRSESFFIGAGRRRYDNGKILNIYNPLPKVRSDAMEAQPWEGLYWTTAVSRTQAAALHFWFEKLDTSAGIENSVPYARANGLQVRCVKQQGR